MTLPRLLADVSQNAAVNVEDQAVDKVGSLGSQEHSGAIIGKAYYTGAIDLAQAIALVEGGEP